MLILVILCDVRRNDLILGTHTVKTGANVLSPDGSKGHAATVMQISRVLNKFNLRE